MTAKTSNRGRPQRRPRVEGDPNPDATTPLQHARDVERIAAAAERAAHDLLKEAANLREVAADLREFRWR